MFEYVKRAPGFLDVDFNFHSPIIILHFAALVDYNCALPLFYLILSKAGTAYFKVSILIGFCTDGTW